MLPVRLDRPRVVLIFPNLPRVYSGRMKYPPIITRVSTRTGPMIRINMNFNAFLALGAYKLGVGAQPAQSKNVLKWT